MELTQLTAISPIDGRYLNSLHELQPYFSEFALIKFRVIIEIKWLQTLAANSQIKEIKSFSKTATQLLNNIIKDFSIADAQRVKEIEKNINHDLKAVEYFIKEKISTNRELTKAAEFIHFGCTSEDINNLAYGLMLNEFRKKHLLPQLKKLINILVEMAHRYSDQAMLAHTHGQPGTPTTVGKEIANFAARLTQQLKSINSVAITGKFSGAVGNFNAHLVAYPDLNWLKINRDFVESFGLKWNEYTTQIEPHDNLAELFAAQMHYNTILIGLCRDIWSYIAIDYFKQKSQKNEVGSSTMPHKVNPIDFENAEGNLGIANALFEHFINKLPISRWQRDLSDSTVLRNIGVAFAHTMLAINSLEKGLNKIEINKLKLIRDLNDNWQVLAEAIQTVMRRYNIEQPYEKLKALTRNKKIDKKTLHKFISTLDIPQQAKTVLLKLTPETYLGLAAKLAKQI